jgi:hypothetical protein
MSFREIEERNNQLEEKKKKKIDRESEVAFTEEVPTRNDSTIQKLLILSSFSKKIRKQ